MVKAVIFDLDDTLISEREYITSGFNVISKYLAEENNLDKEVIFNKMNELFEESSKELFNRLLDDLNISYDLEYIKSLVKIYREHEPQIKFFDDVLPTINALKNKGYKIGLITDGYKETQRRKIKALNCENLFDQIIVTDELGREFWKPHEKAYKLMAEKLKCEYKNMSYIGDNEEKDFITANQLGFNTFRIIRYNAIYSKKQHETYKKYEAKIKIYKLNEILRSGVILEDFNIS